MKRILIVSMPFGIGVGGFIRSRNVLPHLARELYKNGFQADIYIPFNALLTALKYYSTKSYELGYMKIIKELQDVEKESGYSVNINYKAVVCGLNKINRSIRKDTMATLIPEHLKPFFRIKMEKDFIKECFQNYKQQYSFVYSMHETIDALTALSSLVSKESKVAILFQSDLKFGLTKLYSIKVLKKLVKRGILSGFLAVSPQPFIDTPELIHLAPKDKIKIIFPGNALDPIVFKIKRSKDRIPGVVYFGRISIKKGIFDLVKAWKTIEKKCENATMYIIGEFENNKLRARVNALVRKNKLRRIKFIGPLQHKHLFKIVSRFSILAYPSYQDSYALTVLESLALNLNVVAYDIPVMRYLYFRSPKVTLVPKRNYKLLAMKVMENLKRESYDSENDFITNLIIKLHSSWSVVAFKEFQQLQAIYHI